MKRMIPVLFLVLLLMGCSKGPKVTDTPWEGDVNTWDGVTMEVVEGTASPGSVTVTILNSTDAEIDSGNAHDFSIQMEKNGDWYPLEEPEGWANTAEALIFMKDQPVDLAFSWANRYGDLPKGHYRAVKGFFAFNPEGPPHERFTLAAEFTLD